MFMNKRILAFGLVLILLFSLCGCGASFDSVKKNLEDNGYEINVYDEELLDEMQTNLTYIYKGEGKILNALSATNGANKITVIEFEKKSDLEIMYKELQVGLQGDEKMDFSANILVYGTPEALKTALK